MKKYPQIIKVMSGLCLLFCFVPLFAQEATPTDSINSTHESLSGQVVGTDGDPIVGASVHVKGADINSITDLNGHYYLNKVSLGNDIEFTYIGYGDEQIKYQGQDTINIVLKRNRDNGKWRTIKGYIRDAANHSPLLGAKVQSNDQKYSAMTNEEGFFTIRIPEYLNQLTFFAPDYAEVEYPLQGRQEMDVSLYHELPPLRNPSALSVDAEMQSLLGGDIRLITHSGAPAIGASMFIRGYNSLNAGSQPLIIVDGAIFDNQYDRASIHEGFILNPLSNISVEDIESIQVLKNGTSLYGTKGGNGVVLITTKRGKDPVTRITASIFTGANMQPKTTPLLDGNQFRVYTSDMLKGAITDPSIDLSSAFPFLNDNPSYYDYLRYHNNNNWAKDVYRNGVTQSYNVDVGGGDDVALYHLSMGYASANSTLKTNDFTKFNARFNSDIELTKKFNFSFDLSYAQTDRDLRDDGFYSSEGLISSPGALAMIKSPLLVPYNYSNSGNLTKDLSEVDLLGPYYNSSIYSTANPVAIIEKGVGKSSQNYLTLSIRPTYKFNDALKLSGAFNYSLNSLFEQYFLPNEGVPYVVIMDSITSSHAKAQNAKQISIFANMFLNWHKQYTVHDINLTGGARFLSDTYTGSYGSGYNTASDLDPNINGSLTFRSSDGYNDAWRSFSWYADAEYSLYNKYMLSAIVSADASSRFGTNAGIPEIFGVRWGIFPSVDAAWMISSENFMKALPFVNLLKLRAEYSLSGNDNLPAGSSFSYFSSVKYINEYTGLTLSNIGNTSLKMETVQKQNVGFDLSVLNNRLSMSADWFHHTTSDLLTLKQFNSLAGLDSYWTNGGKLENRGYEIAVNAKALVLNHFQWEIGGSVAHYKNKILELPDGDYTTQILGGEVLTSVGNPAGLFYGYKTDGVLQTTQEATDANLKIASSTGVGYLPFTAGDMRFVDLNKDGIIDASDKTVIGDPNPDFTGSFNTRITYKHLALSALFTFSQGNDVYNYARSILEGGYNLYNQSAAMQNRWINEGQQTSIPKALYGDPMGNSRFSDRWIEDGSYLRFKTLTVSYDVPVKSIYLSGFTIWASAVNLCTFTKYLGPDPEFSISNSILYQGIDAGQLSQGRGYFMGLKLNL